MYDYISMQEGKRLSEIETAKMDGVEEGMEKAKLQVLKNCLNNNLDIETIISITGFSIDEIEELKYILLS